MSLLVSMCPFQKHPHVRINIYILHQSHVPIPGRQLITSHPATTEPVTEGSKTAKTNVATLTTACMTNASIHQYNPPLPRPNPANRKIKQNGRLEAEKKGGPRVPTVNEVVSRTEGLIKQDRKNTLGTSNMST